MATFFHDVPTTPSRIQPRVEKNLDYRNTFTYVWELPGDGTKGCNGSPLPIACNQEFSIQTNGPLSVLGSNDEIEWFEVMKITEPGIYTVPMVVRAIRPVSQKDRKTRIVVFIHAA